MFTRDGPLFFCCSALSEPPPLLVFLLEELLMVAAHCSASSQCVFTIGVEGRPLFSVFRSLPAPSDPLLCVPGKCHPPLDGARARSSTFVCRSRMPAQLNVDQKVT